MKHLAALPLLCALLVAGCIEAPPSSTPKPDVQPSDTSVPTPDVSATDMPLDMRGMDDASDTGPDSTADMDAGVDMTDATDADTGFDVSPDVTDDASQEVVEVALVVADTANGVSTPLADRMTNAGLSVTTISEEAAPPTSLDLVVVDQTVTGGGSFDSNLSIAWGALDVPMLVMKAHATDELGISLSFEHRQPLADRTDLLVVDDAHPIMDGQQAENVAIFTQPTENYCFTSLSDEAQILANTDASDLGISCLASVWVMPAGTTLQDGSTRTTDRVGLLLGDGGAYPQWTPAAWSLFDASIDWLLAR